MSKIWLGHRWYEVEQRIQDEIRSGADPQTLLDELNSEFNRRGTIARMILSAAVKNQVESGIDRREIVDNLGAQFGNEKVRRQLLKVPDPINLAEYRWLNGLLGFAIAAYCALQLLGGLLSSKYLTTEDIVTSSLIVFGFVLLMLLLDYVFRGNISKQYYSGTAMAAFMRLIQVAFLGMDYPLPELVLQIEVVAILLVLMTSVFLGRKLFPKT